MYWSPIIKHYTFSPWCLSLASQCPKCWKTVTGPHTQRTSLWTLVSSPREMISLGIVGLSPGGPWRRRSSRHTQDTLGFLHLKLQESRQPIVLWVTLTFPRTLDSVGEGQWWLLFPILQLLLFPLLVVCWETTHYTCLQKVTAMEVVIQVGHHLIWVCNSIW